MKIVCNDTMLPFCPTSRRIKFSLQIRWLPQGDTEPSRESYLHTEGYVQSMYPTRGCYMTWMCDRVSVGLWLCLCTQNICLCSCVNVLVACVSVIHSNTESTLLWMDDKASCRHCLKTGGILRSKHSKSMIILHSFIHSGIFLFTVLIRTYLSTFKWFVRLTT